jgi:transposase
MSYRPPIAKEIKEQILTRVKEGVSVAQAAKDAGVSDKIVYTWLSKQSGYHPGTRITFGWEKEKTELLEMIGSLTFKLQKWEKKYAR